MAISPLVPGAFRATETVRSLRDTRAQMDDLQRQIVTGKKSETYGGLGADRITSLMMRARASEIRRRSSRSRSAPRILTSA
jgi:flagellar hook-associated protein 3 FlgL